MFQPWINVVAGIWAFVSAFFVGLVMPWNFFLTGIVIAIFGFWTYRGQWQGIVNGILGIWLIFSAFIPSLIQPWNLLIVGIVVTVLALWRGISSRHLPAPTA